MKDTKMCIRMTKEDYETISLKAHKAYLTLTEYVTSCCLGKQIVVINDLDEMVRQQKYIGNNLNQLTHLANAQKISAVDLDEIRSVYDEINKALTELLLRRRWR